MKKLATQIYAAVQSGRLKEPFGAKTVAQACPGWAIRTYSTFLPKHAEGNNKTTELFTKESKGLYRTLKNRQRPTP